MKRSANCPLALAHDMLSRSRQVEEVGFGPALGRENTPPEFKGLLLIRTR